MIQISIWKIIHKPLCKFVLQFAANGRGNSEIGYTPDCFYTFWDRQKAEFCMLYSFVGTLQTYIWQKKIGHC